MGRYLFKFLLLATVAFGLAGCGGGGEDARVAMTIVDESHPQVHQSDAISLPLGNRTLINVIRVRSTYPVYTYSEGGDYAVNIKLGQITILRGGRIDTTGAGTDLLISYEIL